MRKLHREVHLCIRNKLQALLPTQETHYPLPKIDSAHTAKKILQYEDTQNALHPA